MPKRKASRPVVSQTQSEACNSHQAKRRSSRRAAPHFKAEAEDTANNEDVVGVLDAVHTPHLAVAQDKSSTMRASKKKGISQKKDNVLDENSLPSLTRSSDMDSDLSEPLDEESDVDGSVESKMLSKAISNKRKLPCKSDGVPNLAADSEREKFLNYEVNETMDADDEEIPEALSRPPPVNSDVLPLPWEGRLGYACLNTYLRYSNPPVFASRTCRIASILENRHPLAYPDQPPHPTKNRPDKTQPASVERGQRFVESLGIANARDCIKMIRWNEKYGIKFLRLSSEMFPFASHEEYGYKLAPFAAEVLDQVGKVAASLGHRLTTHPGQFTQLGSPRKPVIDNSIRDLEYHAELLSLLKLPPQADRDAVMILHLGGVFGDKRETIQRFRNNYTNLPEGIKKRLVLENDDVSWSVHDILPLCEELNIPMVLDFHHHNIIFDSDKVREGTRDVIDLFPRILATWKRKNITPKMHYSEPTPSAITPRQRRKHSPRVATLPPCPRNMDLMIEAKDKEQAVFELMRAFKLPGFDSFNDMLPHVRKDENKTQRSAGGKTKGLESGNTDGLGEIPFEHVGMGGRENRVYWPPGMEDWLRPKKREVKNKGIPAPKKPPSSKAEKPKNASPSLKDNDDEITDKPTKSEQGKGKRKSIPRKEADQKKLSTRRGS